MSTPKFAAIHEVDGQQVLFELLVSENEQKRREGIPDINITTDLGWSRYSARLEMGRGEEPEGKTADFHDFLFETFTQDLAERKMKEIQDQFGAQAIIDNMLSSQEYSLDDPDDVEEMDALRAMKGEDFAKIIEVDGRQVLAVFETDLGEDESPGLVVKTVMDDKSVVVSEFTDLELTHFTEIFARQTVDRVVGRKNKIKPA